MSVLRRRSVGPWGPYCRLEFHRFIDFGIETTVVIYGIFDHSGGTIGFDLGIRFFHKTVTITTFF